MVVATRVSWPTVIVVVVVIVMLSRSTVIVVVSSRPIVAVTVFAANIGTLVILTRSCGEDLEGSGGESSEGEESGELHCAG